MNITHGSLFSGIGGFDLAAQWAGFENVFQVEIDKFCSQVLEKNFPEVDRHSDIKNFNGKQYEGRIDIISGGFPCQPFSHAGKKKGKSDNRFLWDEMFRVISEIKPQWVLAENVYGLVSMQNGMVLEQVITDLESEGFTVQSFIIPACGKNAPHRRDRCWIIAHSKSNGDRRQQDCAGMSGNEYNSGRRKRMGDQSNYGSKTLAELSWEEDWLDAASRVCGINDGLSNRVDRIKSLGNAIVPHIAFEFFDTIKTTMSALSIPFVINKKTNTLEVDLK